MPPTPEETFSLQVLKQDIGAANGVAASGVLTLVQVS